MKDLFNTVPPEKSCVLYVDLSAIQSNYKLLQDFVKPGTVCSAVLKADAYGVGQDQVGKALYDVGCRHFFFAYIYEAIQARLHHESLGHYDVTIFVLNGVFPGTENLFFDHNLVPCLISLDQAQRWADFAKKQKKKLPCILHVDTGMGREGLSQKDLRQYVQGSDHHSHLEILYIMSHMANSNNSGSEKNKVQLDRFLAARNLLPDTKASLATFANSSAIALGENYQFDLVRPGMALYGYKNETYSTLLNLKPCLAAYARILLTRTVLSGESIGYNCTHVCKHDTRVALISIGHCDGVMRAASNKGHVMINGKSAPIIGTVSMDVLMVDITDHPLESVHAHMWAKLYGDITSTMDFAQNEGTSVYELMVRHGSRYHRIYDIGQKAI